MEALIIYLLKVSVSIALFYGLHLLFFKRETFFKLRRGYFLFALIFSLIYPLFSFSLDAKIVTMPVATYMLTEIEVFVEGQTNPAHTGEGFQLTPFYTFIFLLSIGAGMLLLRFIVQMGSLLYRLSNQKWHTEDNYKIIYIDDNSFSSFSFFHWIVINTAGQTDKQLQDIVKHERVHASQLHSIDVLLYELFCIAFWWNPFIWLMKNEMKLNLEYLADEEVLKEKDSYKEYQYTLLQINTTNTGAVFINNFNVSHLKKRIIMMNKKRSSILWSTKFLLVVPLALALVVGNVACTPTGKADKETEQEVKIETASPVNEEITIQEETPTKVFEIVEEMPKYPGGDAELLKFVADNLKYPKKAQDEATQGRVVARFVVDIDGSVKDVTILRGIDPDCDAEAIRVIKAMPKWNPGKQNGEEVPVYFNLPILFRLKK